MIYSYFMDIKKWIKDNKTITGAGANTPFTINLLGF